MVMLVLQIIIILSLGGLILIIARKMPILAGLSIEETEKVSDRKGIVLKKIKVIKNHFDHKTADGLKTIKEQSERLKKTDSEKQKQFDSLPDYWEQITKD